MSKRHTRFPMTHGRAGRRFARMLLWLGFALGWAAPAMAQSPHGPSGSIPLGNGMQPIEGGGVLMATRLMEVTPEGAVRPLPGVEGWLTAEVTRPGLHGAQTSTLARHRAVSDGDGMLRFEDVKVLAGAQYRIVTRFQGVTTRSEPFRAGNPPPSELFVHHVTMQRDALELSVHWTVDVGEAFLRVTQVVRVRNESNLVVDFAHAETGLRMPTLSFVAMDRVPTWGLFPNGKVHGTPSPSSGQGHLIGENGAVVFRGPVQPGGELFFQFRYNIPFAKESIRLGAVSDLPIHNAAITFQYTNLIAPRITLENTHRALHSARDNVVRYDLVVSGELAAAEPVRLTIDRLPVQSPVPIWLGTAGVFAFVFVFAAVVVGHAMRRGNA